MCHLLNGNPLGQWVQDPYLCWFPDQQGSRCSCSASGTLQFFQTQTVSDGAPAQGAALLKSPFDWFQSRTQRNKHTGEIKSENRQRTLQFVQMFSDQQGRKENVPAQVLFVGVCQTFHRSDTRKEPGSKLEWKVSDTVLYLLQICQSYSCGADVPDAAQPSGLSTWEMMCSQSQRHK